MADDITLRIDGVDWTYWTSVQVTRQMDAIAGTFSLALADKWIGGAPGAAHRCGHGLPDPHRRRAGHRWLHRPGPPLILRHGARHQRHRTRQERRSGGLRCHPQPRAVAQLHRAPAGPGSGQPLRGARHGRGRRGRAHCQLQARGRRDRLRGPGPRPAPAGAHGLPGRQGRHGAAQGRSGTASGSLRQGENILSAEGRFDMADRFSDYIVKGQKPGTDKAGARMPAPCAASTATRPCSVTGPC